MERRSFLRRLAAMVGVAAVAPALPVPVPMTWQEEVFLNGFTAPPINNMSMSFLIYEEIGIVEICPKALKHVEFKR